VIELCPQIGVEVRETSLPLEAVRAADELFLTSSTREMQPLVRLDGEPVGDGAPGPVTQRLAEAFAAYVRGDRR
jgi:branched-subunit amino acid aminotransferase/4-amino-4-deoxychorismate lyase